MTFGSPALLLLLAVAALAGIAAVRWAAWRRDARRRFGRGTGDGRDWLLLSATALVVAAALAAFAAARPQFGRSETRAEQRGIDLAIVLDVSTSMLSTDAEPSRLARAQAEIDALLAELAGDRVGLVVFARQALVRSPLTTDVAALRGLAQGVDSERGLLEPGSDLGAGIEAAAKLLAGGEAKSKVMLVVSDGEDHGSRVEAAAGSARSSGIRIYTAGVGTAEGAPVVDPDPLTGVPVPRIGGDGRPIVTRLDEEALRGIARDGGGEYVALAGEGRPLAALSERFEALADTLFGTREATRPVDRFQLFAALALLLADGELLLGALRGRGGRFGVAAKMGLVAGPAVFLAAWCGTSVADINGDGNRAYERGEYAAALDLYRTAQARETRAELSYNAGNALERLERFDEAIAETLKACGTAVPGCAPGACASTAPERTPAVTASPAPCALYRCDSPAEPGLDERRRCTLANQVNYALGNHYVAAERLREALDAYRRALLADVGDDDARHNLEVVTRRLTPSPTATPTPGATPIVTATPGETGAGGGRGEGGTPTQAGGGTPATGTPEPGAIPRDPGELSPEELRRELEEALAGQDREFTEEEALRILDLLNEANRRSIEETTSDITRPGPPDY
jgi:Ca-activated chloride channel family protein